MAINFAKFNKVRMFDVDTSEFDYKKLDDLYQVYGEDTQIRVTGLYISSKSQFDPEAPMLATDNEYVNLPQHQLDEVKAMLRDHNVIAAINRGELAFTIVKYYQKRFKRDCYKAVWCNYSGD